MPAFLTLPPVPDTTESLRWPFRSQNPLSVLTAPYCAQSLRSLLTAPRCSQSLRSVLTAPCRSQSLRFLLTAPCRSQSLRSVLTAPYCVKVCTSFSLQPFSGIRPCPFSHFPRVLPSMAPVIFLLQSTIKSGMCQVIRFTFFGENVLLPELSASWTMNPDNDTPRCKAAGN